MFVKNELKELKEDLQPDSSPATERLSTAKQTDRDDFLKITLSFLRQMKQDPLADALQSRKHVLFLIKAAQHKCTFVAFRETRAVLQGCGEPFW